MADRRLREIPGDGENLVSLSAASRWTSAWIYLQDVLHTENATPGKVKPRHKVVLWKQMEYYQSFGDSFLGVGGKKGHATTSASCREKDLDTTRSIFIAQRVFCPCCVGNYPVRLIGLQAQKKLTKMIFFGLTKKIIYIC